jgi:DNA adenine methylase
MISLMPYIGGKHRMAKEIAKRLHATGADTLVDVFGGSAAVLLNAGFEKRVYNDADGDLANLFRILATPNKRQALLKRLRWTPVCRKLFTDDYRTYLAGGFSFELIPDQIERARATLHRHLLSWGGKVRCGWFSASSGDRCGIKEVRRYRGVLRKLTDIGEYFRSTCIENLDYQDLVRAWGTKTNVVLFCDPPYDGTEKYYSKKFGAADHVYLASMLRECSAAAVVTYYDTPLIRELYPETDWRFETIVATANCQLKHGNKPKVAELVLTKLGKEGRKEGRKRSVIVICLIVVEERRS